MDDAVKKVKRARQRFFVARELQMSMALLVVLALIGGVVLQSVAIELSKNLNLDPHLVGIMLIAGYIVIVSVLAVYFSHRLIGPFKRLEKDVERIMAGEFHKRLYVRKEDDQHIRRFVEHMNGVLSELEKANASGKDVKASVLTSLDGVIERLSKKEIDAERALAELNGLKAEVERLGKG